MPQFTKAHKEFERLKRRGEKSPKWYRYYDGQKNIENLATYLREKTMYELLYRKWSGSVHGSDIYLGKINKTEDEKKIEIVQLRYIKDLQEVVNFSLILSVQVFRLFISNRMPEKNIEFAKWYLTVKQDISDIATKKIF
jgi:hypothetical protein